MKYLPSLVVVFLLLFLFSCGDEGDSDPAPSGPSVSLSTVSPQGPYLVGVDVTFQLELRTDVTIGIGSFTIDQGGTQLFSKDDYAGNVVNQTFIYKTTRADLESGGTTFRFTLTDKNGSSASQESSLEVEVEYDFQVDVLLPEPSWNLVTNQALSDSSGDNVDIFLESSGGFGGSINTFFSRNETVFYNVEETDINFFDPNISTAQIVAAIDGLEALSSIVVTNSAANPSVINFPIVANIRGKDVYAVIGFSNVAGSTWGYRKVSEDAGN
ncbi:MAG: hypothetical protein AAGC85_11520 [Bacteroidota bacterium]